jgi:hypothetical protein
MAGKLNLAEYKALNEKIRRCCDIKSLLKCGEHFHLTVDNPRSSYVNYIKHDVIDEDLQDKIVRDVLETEYDDLVADIRKTITDFDLDVDSVS